MNYELAKRLKEAGFPQPERMEVLVDDKWELADERIKPIFPCQPTLSELIEWCGVDERRGFRMLWVDKDGTWEAQGFEVRGRGSTPEEAVAELGIALHKK